MTVREFEIVEPDDEVYVDIARRFGRENRRHADWDWTSFSLVQREGGRIVAAGRGITNMGLVEIRGLWVDPDRRGRGIGRRLLAAVEAEAVRRGCTRAGLDTYSWQAPDFYLRLGYRIHGTLDYPNGTKRHFLVKEL